MLSVTIRHKGITEGEGGQKCPKLGDVIDEQPLTFVLICVLQMWEERSCQQVRQWQHWGSGCYKYFCEAGRLHIEVLNNTYTCFYPQQVYIVGCQVV